jgi:hypothetical protein
VVSRRQQGERVLGLQRGEPVRVERDRPGGHVVGEVRGVRGV